jgi:hypothetical protein
MTVNLSALAGAGQQFFNNNGVILSGGKLYSYAAGTTTPQATYTSASGSTAHSNPIILDSAGRIATGEIWLTAGSNYKFVLKTSTDTTLATWDNITGINGTGIATNALYVEYDPAGTGAVSTTVQAKLRETISVKDFGATGDGVTDDTAAIQAAANYAATYGYALQGDPGTYKVTSTISLQCNGDLGEMTIQANSALVSPIVRFGTTSGTPTSYKIITLPRVRNSNRTSGTWGAGVGIELANCNTNTIVIPSATECEVGVTCGGYNSGFAYNNVTLMFVYSNKINLRLKPAASGGWCNQNVFTGGRLGSNTSDFTTSGYVGTRQILLDQGTAINGGPNNNTFINTSIETDLYEYMIAFEESSSYNQFIDCRYEGTNKEVLFNTATAAGNNSNLFIGGYQVQSLEFTFSGAGTSLYNSIVGGRYNALDGSGVTLNISNRTSTSVDAPHIQGFGSSTSPLGKSSTDTDWRYRLYADGLSFKEAAETFDKVTVTSGQTGNPSVLLGAGTIAPDKGITIVGTTALVLTAPSSGVVRTSTDNSTSLGNASFRWSEVFAGTGTINTSDEREKQDIAELNAAEKRVAVALKGMIKKFRFKDAVAVKSSKARIHVGVIAQEVMTAFIAEGLDPMTYSIVCYNEWEAAEDQSAGDRYGIRYDELLAFIIGAM